MGWATPVGKDLQRVWHLIREGHRPDPTLESLPSGPPACPVLRISENDLSEAIALPRLRRSSRISHLAVTAAVDAVTDAGLNADHLARTALIFVTSDGGIAYTRRFYSEVVKAGSGSPLFFPETVYNAPTSHIAARLGLQGEAITLAGDSAAGLAAVRLGCVLLATGDVDHCLIVSAQEVDEITCEAYRRLGLIRRELGRDPSGEILAEGATAVVLARQGGCLVHCPHPGLTYSSNADATKQMDTLLQSVLKSHTPQIIVSGQSGISLDAAERDPIKRLLPQATRITPKVTLGESLANSAIQQVITAALALRERGPEAEALVPAVGFNGQIGVLLLTGARLEE